MVNYFFMYNPDLLITSFPPPQQWEEALGMGVKLAQNVL